MVCYSLFGSLRSSADHIANLHREFSLANAMRGFSLRKRTLRMPCPDHHAKFVRCRCFLHPTDISVHISALEKAMADDTQLQHDRTLNTIQQYKIPNPSGKTWCIPPVLNRSRGICLCNQVFCCCPFWNVLGGRVWGIATAVVIDRQWCLCLTHSEWFYTSSTFEY